MQRADYVRGVGKRRTVSQRLKKGSGLFFISWFSRIVRVYFFFRLTASGTARASAPLKSATGQDDFKKKNHGHYH